MKKKLEKQAKRKKEEEEVCGPRMMHKVNKYLNEMNKVVGQEDQRESKLERQKQMLQTGNTSLFELEKNKNCNEDTTHNMLQKYGDDVKQQRAFYEFCKQAKDAKFSDPNVNNANVQFYKECEKSRDLAKPVLTKLVDGQLVIRDLKLNTGAAKGL